MGLEATTGLYLRSPIVQRWWAQRRNDGRDPDFVALLDGMVAQINERPPARTGGSKAQAE